MEIFQKKSPPERLSALEGKVLLKQNRQTPTNGLNSRFKDVLLPGVHFYSDGHKRDFRDILDALGGACRAIAGWVFLKSIFDGGSDGPPLRPLRRPSGHVHVRPHDSTSGTADVAGRAFWTSWCGFAQECPQRRSWLRHGNSRRTVTGPDSVCTHV